MNLWEFIDPFTVDSFPPVLTAGMAFYAWVCALVLLTEIKKTRWLALIAPLLTIAAMQDLPGFTILFWGMVTGVILWGVLVTNVATSDYYYIATGKIERKISYDEDDGRLVLYRWVVKSPDGWRSPSMSTLWNGDKLHADKCPKRNNEHGIWGWYTLQDALACGDYRIRPDNVLVKILCENHIYYHSIGARVQDAEIVEVIK